MCGIYLRPRGLQPRNCFLGALWFIFTLILVPVLGAEGEIPENIREISFTEKLGLSWNLLVTASWGGDEPLINRDDLKLNFSLLGLTLRTQVINKSFYKPGSFPVPGEFAPGNTEFSAGLYHKATGSRLLYGIQNEWGLPARIRNPWIRSVPFAENHKASFNELKTEPSSTKEAETYLYLKSPPLGIFSGFASVLLDGDFNFALGGGAAARFTKKTSLALEGFYTGRELAPRKESSWFALPPPLPARDFRIYALGLIFHSPFFNLASDWAYSETFAYGRDLYGSLGLRFSLRPWAFSLAADGAGSRYVGRDGSSPGAGFRTGVRIERRGKKSSLFRAGATLRAPGLGTPFERGAYLAYYHFPSLPGMFPVKPSRVSFSLNRNASDPQKTEDRLEGVIGLRAGLFRPAFSGTLTAVTGEEKTPPPFPAPKNFRNFHSAAFSGELSYAPRRFLVKTKLGYTAKKEKEGLWESSLSLTVRQNPCRFSLKIASPDFPDKWTWEISWRLEL